MKFQICKKIKKIILGLIIALISFSCSSVKENEDGPYFGNGFKNGWADQNSISIWTRLTKTLDLNKNGVKFLDMELDKKALNKKAKKPNFLIPKQIPDGYSIEEMEGAMPGVLGEVKLSYYQNDYSNRIQTNWEIVDSTKNYTKQWKLDGLLSGAKYNIELGSHYLAGLILEYDGSYPFAIAAYNAGPKRVKYWKKLNKNPQKKQIDYVDWIELIKFKETRNYVQRVLENYNVYRYILSQDKVKMENFFKDKPLF